VTTYYNAIDKNSNMSFEGLDIHYHYYHSSSNQICYDTIPAVCENKFCGII